MIAELDSCRDELQQQPDLVAGKLRDLESLRQRQRTTGEAISSSTARFSAPALATPSYDSCLHVLVLLSLHRNRSQDKIPLAVLYQKCQIQHICQHSDHENKLQVEVKSWHQQAADVERNERKLQLDMEETEREQLVVKKRITHQPMDVKQATRVRDNL